jgi:hypothetical protein
MRKRHIRSLPAGSPTRLLRERLSLTLALGLALSGSQAASATDYWDASATNDDNAVLTYNEMHHGVSQQHDLETHPGPVYDEDWSFLMMAPYASYEAIVDSTSADIDTTIPQTFMRVDADGTTIIQLSEAATPGAAVHTDRALRWANTNAAYTLGFLRIGSGGCDLTCTAAAQYRIRFHETTIAVPRFNNAGSQLTVLIVQNPTSWIRPIAGSVYFWSVGGTLLGSTTFSLPAKGALVLNTATVAGVAGQGGTITVAHDGGYGGLVVKAVALEPSTGFSFDSPGSYKPL